jgi:hypothetical protein
MDKHERNRLFQGLSGDNESDPNGSNLHSDDYAQPYRWFRGSSNVTLKSNKELETVMAEARKLVLGVRHDMLLFVSLLISNLVESRYSNCGLFG